MEDYEIQAFDAAIRAINGWSYKDGIQPLHEAATVAFAIVEAQRDFERRHKLHTGYRELGDMVVHALGDVSERHPLSRYMDDEVWACDATGMGLWHRGSGWTIESVDVAAAQAAAVLDETA